jgi:ABC-type sulfate/molybdate transport systems ATPase subunit
MDARPALDFDVTLATSDRRWRHTGDIDRAGTLVLFGASGAGKTLTLRALAGLTRPIAGHVRCGDRTLFDARAGIVEPPRTRRIGYVPQHTGLFPYLSVRGNVGFGVARRARATRVATLLRELDLEALADRTPESLSGGERQRVAIARALAHEPALLLLDEPFSSLDRTARRELRAWFAAHVRARGLVVVLVTHDAEEACALGDRLVLVDDGATIATGRPADVLAHRPG